MQLSYNIVKYYYSLKWLDSIDQFGVCKQWCFFVGGACLVVENDGFQVEVNGVME